MNKPESDEANRLNKSKDDEADRLRELFQKAIDQSWEDYEKVSKRIHNRIMKGDEDIASRFTEIFKTTGIRTITVVVMEVPCCSGLPMIVKRALEASGKEIPMEQVVISTRGEVVEKKPLAA